MLQSSLLGPKNVTVVRPYGDRIRDQMFRALTAAGCAIDERHVIPPGTPDTEALSRIIRLANPVLLAPFHGHHDGADRSVNGLALLERLRAELGGAFPWRVVMPVSAVGRAGFTMVMVGDRISTPVKRSLLVIHEDELADANLSRRIRNHVHGHADAFEPTDVEPETMRLETHES